MLVMRRRDLESVCGVNDRDRRAPRVAAALIGCGRRTGMIVLAAFAKLGGCGLAVIVRMRVPGLMLSVAVCDRSRCRMIMLWRGSLRMSRSTGACKGKRDGNGQGNDSTAL